MFFSSLVLFQFSLTGKLSKGYWIRVSVNNSLFSLFLSITYKTQLNRGCDRGLENWRTIPLKPFAGAGNPVLSMGENYEENGEPPTLANED